MSRRLVFLGIKLLRRGRCRCLTIEQAALEKRFHQYLSQGKDSSSFSLQSHEALEAQIIPAQQPTATIPDHEFAPQQLATMATAFLGQLVLSGVALWSSVELVWSFPGGAASF